MHEKRLDDGEIYLSQYLIEKSPFLRTKSKLKLLKNWEEVHAFSTRCWWDRRNLYIISQMEKFRSFTN